MLSTQYCHNTEPVLGLRQFTSINSFCLHWYRIYVAVGGLPRNKIVLDDDDDCRTFLSARSRGVMSSDGSNNRNRNRG